MAEKVKLPEFRISQAAVGRRLASMVIRAHKGEIKGKTFIDTIFFLLQTCIYESFEVEPDADLDWDILGPEWNEVIKSARRSQGARRAAARRRLQREEQVRMEAMTLNEEHGQPESETMADTKVEPETDPQPIVEVSVGEEKAEAQSGAGTVTDAHAVANRRCTDREEFALPDGRAQGHEVHPSP